MNYPRGCFYDDRVSDPAVTTPMETCLKAVRHRMKESGELLPEPVLRSARKKFIIAAENAYDMLGDGEERRNAPPIFLPVERFVFNGTMASTLAYNIAG